jgi:hypothetical protein
MWASSGLRDYLRRNRNLPGWPLNGLKRGRIDSRSIRLRKSTEIPICSAKRSCTVRTPPMVIADSEGRRQPSSSPEHTNAAARRGLTASARSFADLRSRAGFSAGLLHPDFRTPTTIVAFERGRDDLHFHQVPSMEPNGTNRIL